MRWLALLLFLSSPALADSLTSPSPPIGTSGPVLCLLSSACLWSAAQVGSLNPNAPNTPDSTSNVQTFYGADGTFLGQSLYSYGGNIASYTYRADGTAAAKTAVQSGENLKGDNIGGYDGTAYGTSALVTNCLATENWTTSGHGTKCNVQVTKPGSTARTVDMTFNGPSVTVPVPLRVGVADNLTAAGTNQATALALTADVNIITTCATGAGAILAAYDTTFGGVEAQQVFNISANACPIYPASGAAITAGTTTSAANASVSLAAGGHATFYARANGTSVLQGP